MEKERRVLASHGRFVSAEKSATMHRPTYSRAAQEFGSEGLMTSMTPTKGSISVSLSPIVHKKSNTIRKVLQTGQLFKYSDLGDYFAAKDEDSDSSRVMINGKMPKLRGTQPVTFPVEHEAMRPAEIVERQHENSPGKSQAVRSPSDVQVHSPSISPVKLPRKNKLSEQLPSIREAYSRPYQQPPHLIDNHEQQRLEESIHELDKLLSRVRNKTGLRSMSVTRDVKSLVGRQSVDRRAKLRSLAIY